MKKAITTNTTILPIVLSVGSLLWILPEAGNLLLWGGWFVAVLTTYGWMEMNARMMLLRERSRMVSTTYFATLVAVPLLHEVGIVSLLPLALLACYGFLFVSYQERRPEGYLFHAFLLLGISSLVLPQVLWLFPLLLFCCLVQLRSLTLSSFSAALMGLFLSLAVLALKALWLWDFSTLSTTLSAMGDRLVGIDFSYWRMVYTATPTSLPTEAWQFLISTGSVLLISAIAVIQQVQTSYLDKIKVRMFYYVIGMVQCALFMLLILFPEERWAWLHLLIANSAPLTAHYMTLTRGWMSASVFWISLISLILITLFNYNTEWILSLIYS